MVGDRYVYTCTMRGLYTHFPPHEPYIFANDCVYYTVGDIPTHMHNEDNCVARHSAADVTCIPCSHKGEEEHIPAYQVDVTYVGDRL